MQLYTKILIGMVVGVVLGLLVGPNSALLPDDGVDLAPSVAIVVSPDQPIDVPESEVVRTARVVEARADGWLHLRWTLTPKDLLALRERDGASSGPLPRPGTAREGWVHGDSPGVSRYAPIGRWLVGATEWIGLLFLALIKMVVVPLVFFSLVGGIASLGNLAALGRLGARTLLFFSGTTVVALALGVGLANVVQPGKLLGEADRAELLASYADGASATVDRAVAAPAFIDQLLSIVPTNPVAALANGEMLQIIFFAAMFGLALTFLDRAKAQPVVDLVDQLNEAMVMLVHLAMVLAPYGVAALLFKVAGTTGPTVLLALLGYSLVVLGGLLAHALITYGSLVVFVGRLPFLGFLRAISEPLLVSFSTASSSATLPVTKEAVEDQLGVRPQIASFVLPLGATVNMDGTALYQGVAAVFIAQIYSMDLSWADQATIVGSATLASVGAAGVPGAGMITLALVLTAIGVPTEGLALVLGVDRLLDMFRTAVNVTGDSTATVVMSRLEGHELRLLSDAEDAADPVHGFEGRLGDGPHPIDASTPGDER